MRKQFRNSKLLTVPFALLAPLRDLLATGYSKFPIVVRDGVQLRLHQPRP
jgi:hypothetical protein